MPSNVNTGWTIAFAPSLHGTIGGRCAGQGLQQTTSRSTGKTAVTRVPINTFRWNPQDFPIVGRGRRPRSSIKINQNLKTPHILGIFAKIENLAHHNASKTRQTLSTRHNEDALKISCKNIDQNPSYVQFLISALVRFSVLGHCSKMTLIWCTATFSKLDRCSLLVMTRKSWKFHQKILITTDAMSDFSLPSVVLFIM